MAVEGRMRADARRNREQIIAAARDIFIEQGFDAPLDEIARRAEVGIATLYRRFPDRHALIHQVMLDNMERVAAAVDRADATHPDAWSSLVQFLRDAVTERLTLLIQPLEASIRDEFHRRGEIWARRDAVFARIEQLVRDSQRDGRLRSDVGVGDIGIWLIKVCRPVPMLPDDVNARAAHRQLEVLIDGLRAETTGGRKLPGRPLRDELSAALGPASQQDDGTEDGS